jgi:hypothetical protein
MARGEPRRGREEKKEGEESWWGAIGQKVVFAGIAQPELAVAYRRRGPLPALEAWQDGRPDS